MSKSNKMEFDKRILTVSKLLLKGNSTGEILHFTARIWGVSDRQSKEYIKRCYTLWFREFEKKFKAGISYHLSKRRDLYKKAYIAKDWQTCLAISRDEAKLMDSYPSERHELLVEQKPNFSKLDEALNKLSVEDLRKLANRSKFKTYSEEEISNSEEEISKIIENIPDLKKITEGGEKD